MNLDKISWKIVLYAALLGSFIGGTARLLHGQTPQATPAKPEAKVAPVISDALKYAFMKAQLELQQAKATYTDKQTAAQSASAALLAACGPDFTVNGDAQGNPVCVAKPVEKEPVKAPDASKE